MKISLATMDEIKNLQGNVQGDNIKAEIENCRIIKLSNDDETFFVIAGFINEGKIVRVTSDIKFIDGDLVKTRNSLYKIVLNQIEPEPILWEAILTILTRWGY